MAGTPVEVPTRRETLKGGGAVIGGGLLTGCAGESGPSGGGANGSNSSGGENTTTGGSSNSREVTMEPSGTWTFTEVPERYTVYQEEWADIMASLGQFDGLIGLTAPDRFPSDYYNRLPGVSVDTSGLTALLPQGADSSDKEIFYDLDPDINMIDPYTAREYLGFDDGDIEEIEDNIAPFFGSYLRDPNFTDNHPYYTLYEGIGKAAQVFREQERYRALDEFHTAFLNDIKTHLPESDKQGTFATINHNWWGDGSEINAWPSHVPGTARKPIRDLGLKRENNVFREQFDGSGFVQVGPEGLFDADPDKIIYFDGIRMIAGFEYEGNQITFQDDVVQQFENDPVLSKVTAVRNDSIVPGPTWEHGPVMNFFNTEIITKALYPEQFGEYVSFNEPPENEQLFDRQRLADIIKGDF